MSSKEETCGSTLTIDDAFLTTVLRRDEQDNSLAIVSSRIEEAVPVGDNYVSVLKRVSVEYTLKEGTIQKSRSIIVKTPPLGEVMRDFTREVLIFEREIQMYTVTLPAMYKFYEETTGETYQVGPKSLSSDFSDVIILDDLRPLGYVMSNRRQGLDFHHSETAIKALARFHATSVALHDKHPALIEYYEEVCYTSKNRHLHADFMEPSFKSLAVEVEGWPGYERFGDKIRKLGTEIVDKIIQLRNSVTDLNVLNHGDIWNNNMLFRYNEDGKVADVKLLDFQLVKYGSPSWDIFYLLYTSPKTAVLEESEDVLLEEYLKEFNSTLKRLRCSHRTITRARLDMELRAYAFYAVFMTPMLSIMVADPEDAPKLAELTNGNKEEMSGSVLNKAFAGKKFRIAFEKRLVKFELQGLI